MGIDPAERQPMDDDDRQIQAVQRMQDFIEGHLEEEIAPEALAKAALFSWWHARRLFIRWTGLTPAAYVRRLRLAHSALSLRDGLCRVADAAFMNGFDSVDGYQRAFLKEFGVNPGEFARRPVPIPLFVPFGVAGRRRLLGGGGPGASNAGSRGAPCPPMGEDTMEDRSEEKGSGSIGNVRGVRMFGDIAVRLTSRPARKVILKRGVAAKDYMAYCNEVGCDVWGMLASIRSIAGEPVAMWLPERYRKPGTSEYVQGVEVQAEDDVQIPDGYEAIDLPAADFLMVQGPRFADEDFCEAIGAVWKFEESLDLAAMGLEWNHDEPKIQLEPLGKRGYIEFLPVRPNGK